MAHRRSRLLAAPPGLVLALCAFLPAYHDSCAGPVSPYELPAVLPPYLLGLIAAVWAIAKARKVEHPLVDHVAIGFGGAVYWLGAIGWPLITLATIGEANAPETTFMLVVSLLVLLPLRPAIRALARRRDRQWRALRMLWLGAYASSLWFALWLLPAFDSDAKSYPLFGMYLAFLAAVSLAVVTYQNERDREPRSRSQEASLPPSRVV